MFSLPQIKFEGIIPAFLLLFILFTSITSNLAYLNPELKNPSKNIPKTIIYAILITIVIYLSIAFVVLIDLGANPTGLSGNPVLLADVLENVIGPLGFFIMVIAAIISTLIAINSSLGSAVSVISALARDRFFPEKIRETKAKSDMPVFGLLISVIVALLFTIFAGIGFTAEITNFIYFFALAFVNYAAVKLRRKRKELDRPFKAPFYPVLPIFLFVCFLVFAVVLGIIISLEALILGLIILIMGFTYELLVISDKASINFTLSGIKFFFSIIIGLFIWVINNFSVVSLELIFINRILIIVCVFIIITVIFDLLPIGNAQIIDLGKKRSQIIHYINLLIAILQFSAGGVILIIVFTLVNQSVAIQDIIFNLGASVSNIPSLAGSTLYTIILFIFGLTLLICGILSWYRNKEIKSLGI
jgi:hypothetical protein